MKNIRLAAPRLAVAVLAAAVLAGCTDVATPAAEPGTPLPTAPTPSDDPVAAVPVDWADPDLEVPLGDGRVLRDCEGDAPLLCVHDGDDVLGVVEALASTFDDAFAAVLEAEGPEAALRSHVEEYHATFRGDRAEGCPDGYRYEEHPTEAVTLAGEPALRYGFSVSAPDGVEVERNVAWATVLGGQLRSITAVANTEASCVYSDVVTELVPEELVALRPSLDAVAAGSVLPPSTTVVDGSVLGVDGGLDGGLLYYVWQGTKQRIQQPRPMSGRDVAAAGLRTGPAVVTLTAGTGPGSSFVVTPPDGPEARLHVVLRGVLHPVVVQEVDGEVVRSIPDAASDLIGRLDRSV